MGLSNDKDVMPQIDRWSLGRAFKRNGQDVWFLNQLCAITEPELLEESGALYQWRSEYLVGRPEGLVAVARYWSNSRWLERIYTKFAAIAQKAELLPIKTFRKKFAASQGTRSLKPQSIGRWQRPLLDEPNLMGGALPQHLNLVTALDAIYACWEPVSLNYVEQAAENLVSAAGLTAHPIALALHPDSLHPAESEIGKTDRVILFPKSTLVDFMTSVEHVIAVTRRKHGIGRP